MKISNFLSIHSFRQALAAVSACLQSLSGGMAAGYSAVLVPQLREDDSFEYDAQYDSWVAAIFPLTMSIGCIIAGPCIDRFGRRLSFIINAVPFFLGWFLIGLSNNVTLLLLGRAITGISTGCFRPISLIYLSEVTDPKYRAMSLVSLLLLSNIGVIVAHSVGSYLYWKTSAIVFSVPNVLSVVGLLCLKESPLWLIANGKYKEGKDIFIWYRGEGGKKELNEVMYKQVDKIHDLNLKNLFRIIFSKSFMGAFAVTSVIFIQINFSGANTFNFYALYLIKNTFSDGVDDFIIMIIIDALRVVGTGLVFFIIKHVPRRFIFLLCSALIIVCLLCLVAFLYFKTKLIWFGLLSIVLYAVFSVAILSIGWSFVGEVYSSSVRGIGSALTSTTSYLLLFVAVKITPYIIDTYSMTVFYTLNTCVFAICTVILYFVLPETNNMTLQEIEDSLNKERRVYTTEQTKL